MNAPSCPDLRLCAAPARRRLSIALCAALGATLSPLASAQLDVADVPLVLGRTLEPNLMYIHDDSGSMARFYMPDSISSSNARSKSSTYNRIYYDPTVTYLPPLDHNGNSLGNSNFTSAWKDGYARSGSVNLSNNFTPDFGGGTGYNNQRAYYYQFDENLGGSCTGTLEEKKNNDSCYYKVVLPFDVDQQQNFANWYSYYRSRNFAARAGVSRAFAGLSDGIRIGYGRINKSTSSTRDGKSVTTIERGVRKFSGTDRKDFFDWLFTTPQSGNTPLRRALDAAGRYYENSADQGPWSTTPGTTGGNHLSCRKSYTLLMSDGYWNDAAAATSDARENVDNTAGETITGFLNDDTPTSYTYTPQSPFSDSQSNTLADVAMYYWKRDLYPDLDNKVPVSARDPAFWQHMTTFTVGLGVEGTVDPDAAFDAISSGATINWPSVTSNTSSTINDMLHAAVNGRGGFYQANNPDEFSTALRNILAAIIDDNASSSGLARSSSRAAAGTTLYAGSFDSTNWTGKLEAIPFNPITGQLSASADWEAGARLGLMSPSAREIVTWSPDNSAGRDFLWGSLDPLQQTNLNGDARLLNFLRGDATHEGSDFRARNSRLGDIVNSTPLHVGSDRQSYGSASGLTSAERTSYLTRLNSATFKNRQAMVYVGANDGMLHAFNAATGDEVFAFVPNAIFPNLKYLAEKDYKDGHRYYVDGSPVAGDAYIGGSWRTVLVGSTGAGGRAYFALNIESPTTTPAASKVMWEFTHNELGLSIGQASIVKTESGQWVAIFGNGYNSNSHRAQLFVVDLATGTLLKRIDTSVGSSAVPNGLATPVTIDSDRNGLIDLVYAGDYRGNLWKFDFSGASSSDWKVAFQTSGTPKPLFKAVDEFGNAQPITAKPAVARHPTQGLMVYFGTGKFFLTGDQGDLSRQTFYGVQDECALTTTGACSTISTAAKVLRADLLEQEIYYEQTASFENTDTSFDYTEGVRLVTNNALTTQKGFYLDLVSPANGAEGERIIAQPNLAFDGRIDFATLIPNEDPCSSGTRSWYMSLDAVSGARHTFTVFDLNRDKFFDDKEYVTDPNTGEKVVVSGRYLGPGTGFTTTLHGEDAANVLGGKKDKDPKCSPDHPDYDEEWAKNPENCPDDPPTKEDESRWGRQSWRQLR